MPSQPPDPKSTQPVDRADAPPSHAEWMAQQELHPVFVSQPTRQSVPAPRNPWQVVLPLLLLCAGLNLAFDGVWFSFWAFMFETGVAFWLVLLLRRLRDQPHSQLLWPLGTLWMLWGINGMWDIPVMACLLVGVAVWLLWRQVTPIKRLN